MRPDSTFPAEILRQALDAAPDGIVVVDELGNIAAVNRMVEQLFGYGHDALVGMSVDELLPDALRAAHAGHRAEYVDHPRTRAMGSGLDLLARRRSGADFPVEISLSPLHAADRLFVVAIIRDVTERRGADEELRRVHEELALVDDRERIARDLHDTVIQRLFAVGLSLQGALTRAASDPVAERIQLAVDEIDVTIRDIRSAIFALHARRHTGESARDEITAVVRDAARVLGFEPIVAFDGPTDTVLTGDVREHVLATLREALSNVTKHAHATSVTVEIGVDGSELYLRVLDNGIGFAADGITGGNGVPNMQARAQAFGGRCTIDPAGGGGTQVEWRVSVGATRD
jgi:two-component system, NarL family, sensor histidine kinase DevS